MFLHDYKDYKRNKSFWYYVTLYIFILLTGLRYRIGSDTLAYEVAFNNVPKLSSLTYSYLMDISDFEIGYTVLMSVSKTIFDKFWVFLFLQSIMVNVLIFDFFKKYSTHVFTAILAYYIILYYYVNCEVARQGIALAILLFSWKYFVSRKWIKYIIFVFIASLFHTTACVFIMMPILFVLNLWSFLKPSLLLLIILMLLIAFSPFIGQKLLQSLVALSVGGDVGNKIDFYFSTDKEVIGLGGMTTIAYFVSYICLPFFALRNNKDINDIIHMFMLGCLINVSVGIPMVYRLSYYFMPFFIVAIANTLFKTKVTKKEEVLLSKRYVNQMVLVLFVFFLSYKTYGYFAQEISSNLKVYMRFYPYNSIIDKGIDENREKLFRML